MGEETSGKSDVDPPAGTSDPSRKSPEDQDDSGDISDPSPPQLAPEAPTPSTKTPEKKEENEGSKGDGKAALTSPPDDPPTLVRCQLPSTSQPSQPPSHPQPPHPPQPPTQSTPQLPPPKPRGRPPGIPNKPSAEKNKITQAAQTQAAMMHMRNQQQQQLFAQHAAQMAHRNAHQGQPMQMPSPMVQVNADGQQVVHMYPGQNGLVQMFNGSMQGQHRFPVPQQMRPSQPPRQQPPGGPNQTVPVLIPVAPGQSSNPIQVPMSALIRLPDGSYQLRPEFMPKTTIIHQSYIDSNGQQAVRQVVANLKLNPSQSAMMHHAVLQKQMHQQMMMQQQQQRPPTEGQQMQQLTRQNLDRLTTNSASSSRTSEWVGALPPPGPSTSLQPILPMPPGGHRPPAVIEMDDDEEEAAPQLAAEAGEVLNVESLNAEEAFQQESNGFGRRRNGGKNSKDIVHEIDGHKIIETTEPSNSTHLDNDDFEKIAEDDDDDDDRSYEGKEEDGDLVQRAAEWMQNRLEMDIPREERKVKKEPPKPHKPTTRSDDSQQKKRGKRKSNELKALLQMDFGPTENSRRAKNILPILENTMSSLKEAPKSLRNLAERRSASAASGSIAANAKGKETRKLRNRDSMLSKECRACGKAIDEKKADKQHPGYCNEHCYRISMSRSPTATEEEEEDEETSVKTEEQTPEPSNRKKETSTTPTSASKKTPSKEEPEETRTTRRTRIPKKEFGEFVSPKKETPKKKEEEKKVEKKVKEIKKEVEEEVEEQKQKSPVGKKKGAPVDKKNEEPPSKKGKTESPSHPPVPPSLPPSQQTPFLVAALAAPSSSYPMPLLPPRMPAVMPVAPLDSLPPPLPPSSLLPTPPPPAPPVAVAVVAPEMDSHSCRQMSIEQVRAWVERLTGKQEIAQQFADNDIDGQVLIDLKYEDLRGDLKLSLGMAKKVSSAIEEITKRRQADD